MHFQVEVELPGKFLEQFQQLQGVGRIAVEGAVQYPYLFDAVRNNILQSGAEFFNRNVLYVAFFYAAYTETAAVEAAAGSLKLNK